jgi:hypothetical protein
MYDTNSADDGIGRQRLRRLEELAMVATVAVILATYALVGTAHGREANPVMGAVLELAGWPAFAAAKLVVTAGVFALARRAVDLERRGTTRAALAGGGTFALLMVLNAGHDLALLADVWPVGLRWGTSLGYAGAVAGLALVLVVRPDPRPLLDEIVSAIRDVTDRLSAVEARSVALALLVVTSMFAGAVTLHAGPLPAVDRAEATVDDPTAGPGGDDIIYYLERDDRDQVFAYNTDTGSQVWSSTVSGSINRLQRVYGGVAASNGSNVVLLDPETGDPIWSASFPGGADEISGAPDGSVYVQSAISDGSSGIVHKIDSSGSVEWSTSDNGYKSVHYVESTGEVWAFNGDNDRTDILSPNDGSLITTISDKGSKMTSRDGQVVITGNFGPFLYDASTRNKLWTASIGTAAKGVTIGPNNAYTVDSDENIYRYKLSDGSRTTVASSVVGAYPITKQVRDGTFYFDYNFNSIGKFDGSASNTGIAANGVLGLTSDGSVNTLGQEVSGQVSADSSGISGATVELRQSGSVVKATTTNSSGGYSFSAVSDGDYTIRASASGYQNTSKSITVAGSPRTVDLTLNEEGTFTREFQLGPDASQTYPPSLSRLELYRFDRAIELPLPGGTTFEAGPGTWEQVDTTNFNSQGAAYARLEDGQPYRVDVIATSGARQTRWESLGWLANASRPDPYGITVGSDDEPTPTPTGTSTGTATGPTATPIGGDVPSPQYPDLTPPSDPFDLDDDGEYFDDPDGSGGNVSAPAGGDGFGPRLVGDCLTADGSSGVLLEYWDPTYSTSSLEYNVSAGENAYAGERTFETPAGYATWCVADTLTNNGSETDSALSGNVTRNGTTTNFSDTLEQSSVFGGPVGGGGGGEPSTGQQVVGIGLTAGVGYLLVRRFTDFRITSAVSGAVSRARSLVGGGS